MPENRFLDKRCAQHYISTGVLNSEFFQQHLDALPDLSEKACPIEARLEGDEAPKEDAALLEPAADLKDVVPTEASKDTLAQTTLETP